MGDRRERLDHLRCIVALQENRAMPVVFMATVVKTTDITTLCLQLLTDGKDIKKIIILLAFL